MSCDQLPLLGLLDMKGARHGRSEANETLELREAWFAGCWRPERPVSDERRAIGSMSWPTAT